MGFAVSLASNRPKIPSLIYMDDVEHQEGASFLPSCQSRRLFMSDLSFTSITMKDCKNRRRDQRRKKKNSSAVSSKSWLVARLCREPGAENHLRSRILLPRGPPCPRQAPSMFQSRINFYTRQKKPPAGKSHSEIHRSMRRGSEGHASCPTAAVGLAQQCFDVLFRAL